MTIWLKQSTAADVVIGPFVDDTDGKTPETGLTISQADCQLSKNGGAVAQKNDSTAASHLGGGHYKVPLNTTDTGTLGRLRLYVNEGGGAAGVDGFHGGAGKCVGLVFRRGLSGDGREAVAGAEHRGG